MQIPYTKTTVPIRSLTISTLLLSITSLLLFAISVIAYISVYVVYVPQVVTVYPLQFTADLTAPEAGYPNVETLTKNYFNDPSSLHNFRGPQHTISALTSTLKHLPGPALKPDQPYRLTLTLHLPPSPWNRGIGNFPVEVSLYASPDASTDSLLFRSHPAPLLPYRSPLTTNLRALLFSPLHLLDISHDEEEINVPLTPPTRPTITFPTAPESVKVRILGGVELYDAAIKIEARLEGLRWWMYRYRVPVAVLAIGLFWSVGMMAAAMGWWIIGSIARRRSSTTVVKSEPADKGKQVAVKQEPITTAANENIERWITNPATSGDIVKKEESDIERFQVPPYTGYEYSASEDTGSYGYEDSIARYADDEETTETEETETEGEVKEEESDFGYGGVGGSASGRFSGRGGGGGGGPVRRRVSGRGRGRGHW